MISVENLLINEYGKDESLVRKIEENLNGIKKSGYFKGSLNLDIYYEYFIAKNSKANIVISHGFSECIDKYYEMIHYFLEMGYSVFILEHRGHGRSGHLGKVDVTQVNVQNFNYYVEDLKTFIDTIVKDFKGELYLYAHSMGGAIGALFLEKHNMYFKKAVLSSPMMEINTGDTPSHIAKIIAKTYRVFGLGDRYVLGQGAFDSTANLEKSAATNIHRYNKQHKLLLRKKELQRGGASFNWLVEGFKATKELLKEENIKNIKAPILLFQSGNDSFVRAGGHNIFKKILGNNCELVRFQEAKHEIYFENDDILFEYLNKIIKFYS